MTEHSSATPSSSPPAALVVPPDPAGSEPTATAGSQDEIARLRAERDALSAQLDRRGHQHTIRRLFRQGLAAILVLVFVLLLPMATALAWTHRTVFNADRYLATVAPLGSDPTVTDALARQLTDQIYTALDPEPAIRDALPPKAAFLAGPISGEVKTFLGDALNKAITSPRFATLWTNANRFAQAQLVAVLKGKSDTVSAQGDTVVLNLVPLLNTALQSVGPQVSAIVGKNITLPTLSGNELPAVACQQVSAALSRPLPETCGQIPLFPTEKLKAVQQSVTRFDRLTVLALVLLPVLFVGALVVSMRRRRTLLQLSLGGALTVIATRRLVFYLQDRLESAAKPENRAAAHAILSQVLDRLVLITVWLLVGALVIAAVALLTGPYRWARALRHGVRVGTVAVGTGTVRVVSALSDAGKSDETRRWTAAHKGALQIGGAVVAAVLLLVVNLSLLSFLVLAGLLIAFEIVVVRLGRTPPEEVDSDAPEHGEGDGESEEPVTPQQRAPMTVDLTRHEVSEPKR